MSPIRTFNLIVAIILLGKSIFILAIGFFCSDQVCFLYCRES